MLKQKIARIAAFTAALAGTATVLHAYPFGPGPALRERPATPPAHSVTAEEP
jgi:hypothetical protein